ncbi:DNA-binding protein [Actinoplanes sp. TBRC 11911]|nr:DNA-binding protein [Actinoplanes sp. TBRC 11911]
MGTAEIAVRLGVGTRRARQIAMMKGFPEPAAELSIGTIWLTADVEAWIAQFRPHLAKEDRA